MNESHVSGHVNRLAGEEISWVGESPWTGGLCLGTYSGRLIMPVDERTAVGFDHPIANGAINDVAFAGNLMGVSTRSEVVVFERVPSSVHFARRGEPFGGGSHGIVATAAGGFVAPLGPDGLLLIEAKEGPDRHLKMRVGQIGQEVVNCYKLARLGVEGIRGEVIACAARHEGLLFFSLDRGEVQPTIVRLVLPGFDLVDVCSLRSPQWPLAAAALGTDGSVFLSRNILEVAPDSLRLDVLTGRAYSLLSARGHLFLLTSDGMVVVNDLAKQFLASGTLGDYVHVSGSTILMQAADAFLADDEVFFDCEGGTPSIAIDRLVGNIQNSQSPILPGSFEGSMATDSVNTGVISASSRILPIHLDRSSADWASAPISRGSAAIR
jgi:hypothetical protein